MKRQTPAASTPVTYSDPIAMVSLWPLLPLTVIAVIAAKLLLASPESATADRTYLAAAMGAIVVWWLLAVAGATRRAGYPSPALNGAVLAQAAKVGGSGVLVSMLTTLIVGFLGAERAGLVAPPSLQAGEPTLQSTALVLLLVGVLAPVAEEMLFRGTLFRKWRLRWGPGRTALLVSVVFALGHASAPSVFLSALASTVLYTTTGTIWAPIAAHALKNGIPLLVVHTVDFLPPSLLEATQDWRVRLAAMVPGLLGAWWLIQFVRRGWSSLGAPVDGVQLAAVERSQAAVEARPPGVVVNDRLGRTS